MALIPISASGNRREVRFSALDSPWNVDHQFDVAIPAPTERADSTAFGRLSVNRLPSIRNVFATDQPTELLIKRHSKWSAVAGTRPQPHLISSFPRTSDCQSKSVFESEHAACGSPSPPLQIIFFQVRKILGVCDQVTTHACYGLVDFIISLSYGRMATSEINSFLGASAGACGHAIWITPDAGWNSRAFELKHCQV